MTRFEMALVGDLRAAAARYPTDVPLRALVASLRRTNSRFTELWTSRFAGSHESETVTVHHPDIGPVAVDCDILAVPGSDLRIIVQSAAPGSSAAEALGLLGVIGTETMPFPVTETESETDRLGETETGTPETGMGAGTLQAYGDGQEQQPAGL
jgi:hypothetical protein